MKIKIVILMLILFTLSIAEEKVYIFKLERISIRAEDSQIILENDEKLKLSIFGKIKNNKIILAKNSKENKEIKSKIDEKLSTCSAKNKEYKSLLINNNDVAYVIGNENFYQIVKREKLKEIKSEVISTPLEDLFPDYCEDTNNDYLDILSYVSKFSVEYRANRYSYNIDIPEKLNVEGIYSGYINTKGSNSWNYYINLYVFKKKDRLLIIGWHRDDLKPNVLITIFSPIPAQGYYYYEIVKNDNAKNGSFMISEIFGSFSDEPNFEYNENRGKSQKIIFRENRIYIDGNYYLKIKDFNSDKEKNEEVKSILDNAKENGLEEENWLKKVLQEDIW